MGNCINTKAYIYALTDHNNIIRYIGKSKQPKVRFRQHMNCMNETRVCNSHKCCWIKSQVANDKPVNMVILEECVEENWKEREVYWIDKHKATTDLTNHDNGGLGGKPFVHSISYQECKEWVRENYPNIKSGYKWDTTSKVLPDYIPKAPSDHYKRTGEWISWCDFLEVSEGIASVRNRHLLPKLSYNDAKAYVKENMYGITGSEWRILAKTNTLPDFIPKSPSLYYKNKGWISATDFFSVPQFVDYNTFKRYIRRFFPSVKSSTSFFPITKQLHERVPRAPHKVYRKKGWIDWKLPFE